MGETKIAITAQHLTFACLMTLTTLTEAIVLYIVVKMKNFALEVKACQISACQLILNQIAPNFVLQIVDRMKCFAQEVLTQPVVKCQAFAITMIQLLFANMTALSTVLQTNGHVGWDMMILAVKFHNPALLTVNVQKSMTWRPESRETSHASEP